MRNLLFKNHDAAVREEIIRCHASSVNRILEFYGAFCAGDRYTVKMDGVKLKLDSSGRRVE